MSPTSRQLIYFFTANSQIKTIFNLRICGYLRINKAYVDCGCEVEDIRTAFYMKFLDERITECNAAS